jgi:chloramphenicol O-acetyltransferase type B
MKQVLKALRFFYKIFYRRPLRFLFTILVKLECQSFGKGLKVNYYSRVSPATVLGNNVNFNGMNIAGIGKVILGDNFHSGQGCMMIAEIHNYNGDKIPYDETFIPRDIVIGDNVWIGNRVIILGGVSIGEGAIIQAGSVVVSDIEKYAIAGGHPARTFSQRDTEHYERLKRLNKFH